MVEASRADYLQMQIERAEERRPLTLKNNTSFFGQLRGHDLEVARRVYNHIIKKANWLGSDYVMPEGLPESETQSGLAERLTRFQESVDNLDRT